MGLCIGFSLWMGIFFLASEPPPQDLQDPIAILRRMSDRAKSAKVISYRTTVQPFGGPKPTPPRLEGTVLMSGWTGKQPDRFRYDIRILPVEASGGQHVTLGSDGQQYYLIHHDTRKVQVGSESTLFGPFAASLTSFPIVDFLRPVPFENELVSGNVQLKRISQEQGEDCYELLVTHPPGRHKVEALWWISKKDFLPRRRDMVQTQGTANRQGWQTMLSDLVLDPKLDGDPFQLVVPEGYERTGP